MTTTQTHAALLIEPPNIDNLKAIAASNSNVAIRNALLAAIKWIQCLERQLAVEKTASFRDQVEQLQDELAKLQPAQEPAQAGELPDEREAFEAWARPNGYDLRRNDVLGHYSSLDTSRAWSGYRAALAARKPLAGLTREQMEAGRHQVFSTNNPFCPCDSKTFRKVSEWTEREFCRINGLEVKT